MEFIGFGSIRNVKFVLSQFQAKNIFLVTGNESYKMCGAEEYLTELLSPYNVTRFIQFNGYPKIEDVTKGIELYKTNNCKTTLAVGGGRVIDMAKLVTFFADNNLEPYEYLKNPSKKATKKISFVAVPTTAGSGSEATKFAVLYINKQKYSIENEFLLPQVAIIDPELTMSMTKRITAITGTDALCQAVESYWSINSNRESKAFAQTSLKLIAANLEKSVNHPDSNSRLAMAKAAHLSGKAINITKTTACHAISYPMTSYFGIPHGHAAGLTLSSMFEFISNVKEEDVQDNRGCIYIKNSLSEIFHLFGTDNLYDMKQKINLLMESIGLETKLGRLGIQTSLDFDTIINNGFNPERIKNNPRRVTKEAVREILNAIR